MEKPDPTPEYAYQDGVYYGRDEAEHVIVRIVVKDGKIVSAEIVTPKDFDADHAEGILAAVVSSQTVERADSDTADDSTLAIPRPMILPIPPRSSTAAAARRPTRTASQRPISCVPLRQP